MRRLAALNLAQRIVLVIALAAVLRVVWVYLTDRSSDGGWFGYSPLTEATLRRTGPDLGPALLAVAFIAVWASASVWLLGRPYPGPPNQPATQGQTDPRP